MTTMMTGSEKQVAWATTIKSERTADVRKYLEASLDRADKAGQGEQFRAVIAKVMDLLDAQTSASWWIDNSKADTKSLLTPFYKQALTEVA